MLQLRCAAVALSARRYRCKHGQRSKREVADWKTCGSGRGEVKLPELKVKVGRCLVINTQSEFVN